MKTESKHKAGGEPVSSHQRLISTETKKAIKSPQINTACLYDTKNLPEYLLTHVRQNGLYEALMSCDRCYIHLPDNVEDRLLSWIDKNSKRIAKDLQYKFKPMTLHGLKEKKRKTNKT